MARRTKAAALETRQIILDAAEQVFHRHGVSGASLNDIAREAGVTRGAIYWHFKNKHDVFLAMTERRRLPIEALALRAEDENEPDPLGRLRDFLVFLLKQVEEDPRQRRVFEILFQKCEFSGDNEQLLLRQREACWRASDRMHATFRNAIRRQQLPANLDLDTAVPLLHAQITGLVRHWLLDPGGFALADRAEAFVDACLHSLRHSTALLDEGQHRP